MSDVRLGWSIGPGEPVRIPIRHMCVAGQTQEAGKTTALEGMITRAGLTAVTFITKRGEGSFKDARHIKPYFREQADWQFVASILEASRGEKLKFERAWIIRASKGAKTLAEVQQNVRKAMLKAKGLSADVYLTLDAYLDAVVPTISKVKWATFVDLKPGVNVMDLTAVPSEMQHLIIKSTLDWVLEHAQSTVVVVPEAWKFIPQGRGTPVKLSAEAFIRQAAGMGNYLWLDSQDIGGIDKTILRSVPVWVLGVQREANEVKRTLSNIPASTAKPSASALAVLELGQFYACWGKHVVKTYAQPTWVDDELAQRVAWGEPGAMAQTSVRRAAGVDARPAGAVANLPMPEPPVGVVGQAGRGHHTIINPSEGDDDMTPAQEKKLDTLLDRMAEVIRLMVPTERREPNWGEEVIDAPKPFPAGDIPTDHDTEALYQSFKARLLAEAPALLKVIVSRPEIEVTVTREVLKVDGNSTRGRIARLIHEGFFDESAVTSADIGNELAKRGRALSNIELGNELKALIEMGFFRKDNKWINLVPAMRDNVKEKSA